MRQFITGKKIIFVIFLILITIFMINLNSKWDSEPIYSNRLKVASIFSADADFELYRYKFSVENGYNKGSKYFDIDYCEAEHKDYLSDYISNIYRYAEKGVDEAKIELLELSIYKNLPDGYQGVPCPSYEKIRKMARYEMDRLFNKNFSNLGNWISESSDLFDSGLVSYNEYLGAVAAFYYTYGYNDLGDEIINNMHKDGKCLSCIEKNLINIDVESAKLYRYLLDESKGSILENYYSYNWAKSILSSDKQNLEALQTIKNLASKGYGDAIFYLFKKDRIYNLPIDTQINYLIRRIKRDNSSGEELLFEILSGLYRYKGDNSSREEILFEILSDLYRYKGDNFASKIYAEKSCDYGRNLSFRCNELLSRSYFENKEYDKAKERYESLFKYLNPARYGESETGVKASKKLGDIYYRGLGSRQDLEKAKNYYGIACDYKDQEACTLYKEVNEKVR